MAASNFAVHGKNVILSMWVTDQYYPVLCGTDCSYTCVAEFVEKTGATSAGAREWARRLEEHNGSVSGLTKIDNDASLTFFYILQVGIRRVEQLFKMTFSDDDGNSRSITGNALIGTMSISGPYASFAPASIEIKWNGAPSMDVIDGPVEAEVQDPLYIDCVEGETSVHDVLLEAAGITILEVARSGDTFQETTGTPGNQEFKYGGIGVGTIEFDTTNPFNSGEWIYVLYKKI